MDPEKLKHSFVRAGKGMYSSLPVLVGAILLIGLASAIIPKSFYSTVFSMDPLLDSFIGSVIGSIMAGNPITSYIIGGELLEQGISLMAVTAFMVSWVTVGMVQLPAESILLGKRFAIIRNLSALLLSILVAVITVTLVNIL